MSPCISVSLFLLPGRLLDKRACLEYWRHNGARNRLRFTFGVDCTCLEFFSFIYPEGFQYFHFPSEARNPTCLNASISAALSTFPSSTCKCALPSL